MSHTDEAEGEGLLIGERRRELTPPAAETAPMNDWEEGREEEEEEELGRSAAELEEWKRQVRTVLADMGRSRGLGTVKSQVSMSGR